MKWLALTLICAVGVFGRVASAADNVPISPPPHTEHTGPYLWGIGGHEIINVKASADGWNSYERCSILDRRTVEILTRTQGAIQHPEDLDIHCFRQNTFKNRVGYSPQTAMYLVQRIDLCTGGRRRGGNLRQQARCAKQCGGEKQPACFLIALSHVYKISC